MTAFAVSYQGEPGANSHIAIQEMFPDARPLPCETFEAAMDAVVSGAAAAAMIPVENTIAGRVGDIHYLLPRTELRITGEHYLPIRFQLMGLPGAPLGGVKAARSHIMGLGQCRDFLRARGIAPVIAADTAGAAREVAEANDPALAAIAPRLAASVYGLEILAEDIEDEAGNTTRFVVFSRQADAAPPPGEVPAKTAFLFNVRNIPAALFKALGGFATNGVNMTKLESYQVGGEMVATQFYAEIDGRPDDADVALALEELGFFSQWVKQLGVFARAPRPGGVKGL